MHVGKAGINYAADSLHALSWQGCICYKHGLSSPYTQQVHLQQLQSRLVWRDSSKVQALNHSADSKRSTAKGSKPSNKQQQQQQQKQQQQQQKQKQWRRQSNTRHVPSSRPAENKSARTKKVPLHVQIEELLEECKAHQHWAPTPGPAVQHSDQGQGRHRTESASAGREALSKLLRLAELCSLWDTAQGQAARQQALATSLSAAPSAHTARIAHPHEAARLAGNAHTSSATPFGAPGTNRQSTGAASASRPQEMGVNQRSGWHEEHMHQGPVLGPLHAPGQHMLPGPPWISTPPDLPTRMGACADRLLAAIALYVSPFPTPSSPSAATLLGTWSHTVIPSEQERQGGATAGLAPIPVHPSQASLAPLPNDSNPTDRTPHITLNQHSASFAWDVESASQLAHAMAATQRYHAGLCAHVERATVQHAQAHGHVEIRCAARIMAAWAKLGHAPSQTSLAALLHTSGAAMREMAASLAPTPAAPLPRAPTDPLHSRIPSSLPNPALLRAMPQQTPPSGPQPPTHTPTLQASGWATDQAAAPAIAPATAQATAPAHSPKLSSSSGQAIHLAAVTPAAAQGSAPAHSRKLQASSDPDIALASAPAVAPALAPAQSHKLQASARAIADLAWAASQLDSWGARRGSRIGTVAGHAGRAASTPPPSPLTWVSRGKRELPWVNRGTGGGGKRFDGSGSSDSTDKQTNVRSSVGDVGWGGGAGSFVAPTAAPLNAALLLLPSHGARPSSAPAMAAHTTTATAAALAEAANGFGSGGLQAHTGGDGRLAPLDLAQAQQAWLEALQQCSLPHLPALNLAGLGRLLHAAAFMHMRPCSYAWLQSAAASLLAATPELHAPSAPPAPGPQSPSLPSHTPPPHSTSAAAAPFGHTPQPHPAPSSGAAQPHTLSSALSSLTSLHHPVSPPPLGPSPPHLPQSLTQTPPPPLTGPRLASLTDAALGLAELWAGHEVFRSVKGRRGVLHLLPGSSLQAPKHVGASVQAAATAESNREAALRLGSESVQVLDRPVKVGHIKNWQIKRREVEDRHGKGEEEVQQGVLGSSVGSRDAGGGRGETGPKHRGDGSAGVSHSRKQDAGSGAGSAHDLSEDGCSGMRCNINASIGGGGEVMQDKRRGQSNPQTSAAATKTYAGPVGQDGIDSDLVQEGAALAGLQEALARLFSPELLPHMGPTHLAPLLWASAAFGAGPYITPQGKHMAMERLHGHLPSMRPGHLVLALHAAAMLRLRPYRAWMADWQQQLLRHAPALSCTDSVRMVCSLAVLLPPAAKIGAPVTAACVGRLSHHLPAMSVREVSLTLAAIRRLYPRLSSRPLQRLVHAMEDRLQFMLC